MASRRPNPTCGWPGQGDGFWGVVDGWVWGGKNKPSAMLEISPKGTVPVLQLPDGRLIEESLEIIYYSLDQNDPEGLNNLSSETTLKARHLIEKNDMEFVGILRKYKYFERYPENTQVLH